jgi:hypothetical protein
MLKINLKGYEEVTAQYEAQYLAGATKENQKKPLSK